MSRASVDKKRLREEFVCWAFGDSLDNAFRGVIAEFLVYRAVNGKGKTRANWSAFDIETPDGKKLEVKASGYVQSWKQTNPSIIEFEICKKEPWSASSNKILGPRCRYADIWVFAVHKEQDRNRADPFETEQWRFLVASSAWLNEKFGEQKRVRLSVLLQKGLEQIRYDQLPAAIAKAL